MAYEDDPETAASVTDGERLIAEYEALLSGFELSDSNKVKCLKLTELIRRKIALLKILPKCLSYPYALSQWLNFQFYMQTCLS